VLGWLKVNESRVVRSLALAGILKVSELIGGYLSGLLFTAEPGSYLISTLLSTFMLSVLFYLSVRNLLVLKVWQYFSLPVVVSILGNIMLAVISITLIRATT